MILKVAIFIPWKSSFYTFHTRLKMRTTKSPKGSCFWMRTDSNKCHITFFHNGQNGKRIWTILKKKVEHINVKPIENEILSSQHARRWHGSSIFAKQLPPPLWMGIKWENVMTTAQQLNVNFKSTAWVSEGKGNKYFSF